MWRKKLSVHDQELTSLTVKHSVGSVMVWASMAASGTDSLIFIDGVT